MDATHPSISNNNNTNTGKASGMNSNNVNGHTEIVMYIVGGVTFEEALHVNQFNRANPQFNVILGGSCIHNSTSLLNEVSRHFM